MTPGTPVIDRGFESMIDHKSLIDQRVDTSDGRHQDDKDSVESHQLNPIPPRIPASVVTSAERIDKPPGELRVT